MNKKSKRICVVGAPGAGKTTFIAQLYASLLQSGVSGARLVSEYAQEWLGAGNKIDLKNQIKITQEQAYRETRAQECNFSPILCDSAVWLAAMYVKKDDLASTCDPLTKLPYFHDFSSYGQVLLNWQYDLTIFVPLWRNDNQQSQFRIHDYEQSLDIEERLVEYITDNQIDLKAPFYQCRTNFRDRGFDIQDLTQTIKEMVVEDVNDFKYDDPSFYHHDGGAGS